MATSGSDRRRFLGLLTSLLMALIGVLVAIPAAGYFFGPLRRKSGSDGSDVSFQDAGPLSDIPLGQWRLVSVEMVHADGWKRTRVVLALGILVPKTAEKQRLRLANLCRPFLHRHSWGRTTGRIGILRVIGTYTGDRLD
jgi:hypothetical protein